MSKCNRCGKYPPKAIGLCENCFYDNRDQELYDFFNRRKFMKGKTPVITSIVLLAVAIGLHMYNNPDEDITVDNAVEQCKLHNVRCPMLKEVIPEWTVEVLGKGVQEACGQPILGCVRNGKDIKLWYSPEEDKPVYNHEMCHVLCQDGSHYNEREAFDWVK